MSNEQKNAKEVYMVKCSVCDKDCVWKNAGKCSCGHYFSKHSEPDKGGASGELVREFEDPELKTGGCGLCSKAITNTGTAFKFSGVTYHEECLRCDTCSGWIDRTEVVCEDNDGKIQMFHEKCRKVKNRDTCGSCNEDISGEFREFGDTQYHDNATCMVCLQCKKDLSAGVYPKKGKIFCSKKCWRKNKLG